MKYRRLGSTGLTVSEIGFGAWGIGGPTEGVPAYGPANDQESAAALWMAYEAGVDFYDTSDLYGAGHSELVIGETFHGVRDEVLLATKTGMATNGSKRQFSSEHIKRSLDSSLQRLSTDYVDLYQLHGPSIEDLETDPETLVALEKLRREGMVRAFGITVNSPDDGLSAVSKFGFQCIQVNFNLVDQRALINGLFDLCLKRDVGVIVRTPLCFGFLTGAYSSGTEFASGDHRSNWSPIQRQLWSEAGQRFATALKDVPAQTGAQVALRYCLSYQSVSTVIPGMLIRDHVKENLLASHLGPLSKTELAEIESIYRENEFFAGR